MSSDWSFTTRSPGIGIARRPVIAGVRLREESQRGYRRRAHGSDLPVHEQTQFRDEIFQGLRLCIELFRGARALLRAGGIALGDLVHLGDGRVDLFYTLRLLAGSSSDFCDERVGRTHLVGDLRQRLLDFGCALRPFSTVGNRRLDLVRGLLGRGGATLS